MSGCEGQVGQDMQKVVHFVSTNLEAVWEVEVENIDGGIAAHSFPTDSMDFGGSDGGGHFSTRLQQLTHSTLTYLVGIRRFTVEASKTATMMTESNNLLYHPNDAAFDRLEEMEGGALTRYPVLRSVPVPTPRPWSTRGAIALLVVCGVVFGVIAAVSVGGAPETTDIASTENQASANIGGALTANGSGSLGATTIESGSLWHDGSNSDSSADEPLESTSDSAPDDASRSAQESKEASFGSNTSSTFKDVLANPFESSMIDSLLDSSENSASDAGESQSAATGNTLVLVSSSASIDVSVDSWFTDSSSASEDISWDGSDSAADWDSLSSSISALSSQSEDSSLGF